MINQRISIPYNEIAAFCERHHIRKLSLFGSVLREDFRPDGDDPSDVDVLVEFEPGHTPGWEYYTWGDELSPIFGHTVDLLTPQELSRHFRERVLAEAVTIYDKQRNDPLFPQSTHSLGEQLPKSPTASERDRVILMHLLDEAKQATAFVHGLSRTNLDNDSLLNNALQFAIERIGRGADALSTNVRKHTTQIAWSHWQEFSQRLTKEYNTVDLDEVWRTVTTDLPPLIAELEKLLADST